MSKPPRVSRELRLRPPSIQKKPSEHSLWSANSNSRVSRTKLFASIGHQSLNDPTEASTCSNSEHHRPMRKLASKEKLKTPNMIDTDAVTSLISAHSWIIFDCDEKQVLLNKKEHLKREVASLTKMMTFYTVLKLLARYKISPKTTITISNKASAVTGTSANLVEGDVLSIE